MSLPGAAELFRPTQGPGTQAAGTQAAGTQAAGTQAARTQEPGAEPSAPGADPGRATAPAEPASRGTGRVKHDEKITVYVSGDELVALEQARLTLRARHGLAVDRGRIVREAIAATIADLEANGDGSELIRRLSAT